MVGYYYVIKAKLFASFNQLVLMEMAIGIQRVQMCITFKPMSLHKKLPL